MLFIAVMLNLHDTLLLYYSIPKPENKYTMHTIFMKLARLLTTITTAILTQFIR